MSAEETAGDNDEVLEFYGLKVLVDKDDAPVLKGQQSILNSHSWVVVSKSIILMRLHLVAVAVHLKQPKFQVHQKNVNHV